jgi:hypothetical protein
MVEPHMSPEERRLLGLAALTALVSATIWEGVRWAMEEGRRALADRRARHAAPPLVTVE